MPFDPSNPKCLEPLLTAIGKAKLRAEEIILRNSIMGWLDNEISRLSGGWRSFFMRDASAKIEAFRDLKSRVIAESITVGKPQFLKLIQDWESEKPETTSTQIARYQVNNNDELMGLHRNYFFSAKRPTVKTTTQINLEYLKSQLGWKKPEGASPSHENNGSPNPPNPGPQQ